MTIRDVDIVVFLCEECGTCWRIELGYVQRVRRPADPDGDG
ncbi:MAG: hypothetical protein PVG83_02550 [Acidimicrobiia bacterium]